MIKKDSITYIALILSVVNLVLFGSFSWLFFGGKLELRTKKLIVIDQNKVERIHLDSQSSDVRVFGKNFKRISPASGLILFNSKGDERGGFAVLDDGTASVTIDSYSGEKVSERTSMYVMKDGSAGFIIKDINNSNRMKAELTKDNVVEIKVFDKSEKELKSFTFE